MELKSIKFLSHEMTLKVWLDERPAYKRSLGDGKTIKFTINSKIIRDDGKIIVLDSSGDSHLINVLRDHIVELYHMSIDCSYLLEEENYKQLVIPWAYTQKSVCDVLDLEELEPGNPGLTESQLQTENKRIKEIIDFLHNNILLETCSSTLQN